ncbi:MAG: hypothetical protein F6K40_38335 [Okeania sp. SIO3I5]|uniref:hypothetical protein n=1 Tax=Okeania sp. SIO3I5 TaxID=2607805 RepID=UPI0013B7BD11|nr:hypothetical protein [Okeania sp. SIO3I5]NEQ41730.1 hypothetical protein [Okeania sp. SIO3I5]NEQ41731.1 hypothetical protein [Okeania sp. SIO3I5]
MSEYFYDSMFEKVFGAVDISLQLFDNRWTIGRHFVSAFQLSKPQNCCRSNE